MIDGPGQESSIERVLPGRNRTKADVSLRRVDGRAVAVKDYGPRPWWIRATVGRLLTAREARAYRAAAGIEGLPAFVGRLGPWTLATEWVDGTPLAKVPPAHLPPDLFDRLRAVVAALHGRGIALGDLHHRDVLVGPSGEVHVVDLATALVAGPRPGPLRRALLRRLMALDRIAVARMEARVRGTDEAAAIQAAGGADAAWHGRGRRVKALWDRLRGRRRGTHAV